MNRTKLVGNRSPGDRFQRNTGWLTNVSAMKKKRRVKTKVQNPNFDPVLNPSEPADVSGQSDGREWYHGGPPGGRMNFRPHRRRGKKKNKQTAKLNCDTCGLAFKNGYKCKLHIAQHIECPMSGCEFTASQRLVLMHCKMKHGPKGKYMLDTPDEISKWREQRRRNYPTLQIKEEEEEKGVMEAREQTGGVLETPQFRHSSSKEA